MVKGGNLAPLEYQNAKFNLAPNESKVVKIYSGPGLH